MLPSMPVNCTLVCTCIFKKCASNYTVIHNIYLFMYSVEPENAMLLYASMPGVFQPLSSSQSLPLSGICPSWTQDSLFAEKKETLCHVLPLLCPGLWWASYCILIHCLTYSLRSPCTQCSCSFVKTNSFTHNLSFVKPVHHSKKEKPKILPSKGVKGGLMC